MFCSMCVHVARRGIGARNVSSVPSPSLYFTLYTSEIDQKTRNAWWIGIPLGAPRAHRCSSDRDQIGTRSGPDSTRLTQTGLRVGLEWDYSGPRVLTDCSMVVIASVDCS
eukprot:6200526-Pleurochrysis_carterae.AAC.5